MAGVDVGHQFFSRAEMVAVGFHSHWLNGIDYMGQSYNRRTLHIHQDRLGSFQKHGRCDNHIFWKNVGIFEMKICGGDASELEFASRGFDKANLMSAYWITQGIWD
ncbi:Histone-lysine N-methyltransferase, H3 lysine-9 specific SUVH4 [Vitis vinifera]|uniref:Histone-lysine N-methyltransferase, H3 lysine-9 specific SUVH4 n=1 Tax=Vitis vinifera TaxID=29760 RepID=A0A438JD73_VITVI|nr:Histone-lysine N-methyltransferase, H3 lysine-9 specific SUVH4 [Vitis vinifera]